MSKKKLALIGLLVVVLICIVSEVWFRVNTPELGSNLFDLVSKPGSVTKRVDSYSVILAHNQGSNWHTWIADLRDSNDQRVFRFVAATSGEKPGFYPVINQPGSVVTYQPLYLDINRVAWSDFGASPFTGYWEHRAGMAPRPLYRNYLGLWTRNPIPLNL